jgi:hypothetical protein
LIIALSGGDDTPTAGPSTTGSTAATTAPSTSGPTTVSTTTTSTTIGSAADLLLSDDFASGSRWSKGEDADSIWGPGSGQYRIMIKTSDSVRIRAPFTGEIPARLRLEVSATRPVRADFGFFGLYCRGQGDSGNPYYEGHINSNGYWRIRRVEPGSTPNRTLAEPSTSTEYSSAIRATGSNRVVFDCLGGTGGSVRLTLWANGQKIADVVDNQGLPGGSAGILANADQPLEILFDDFAARRI